MERAVPYRAKDAAPKLPVGRGSLVGAKVIHVWDDDDDRRHYTRAISYRVDKDNNDLYIVDVERRQHVYDPLRAMKTVIAIGAPPRQHKGML